MLVVGAVLGVLMAGAGSANPAIESVGFTQPAIAQAARVPGAAPSDTTQERDVKAKFTALPLRFVENRGQAGDGVNYYLQGAETSVSFGPTGLTYGLTGPDTKNSEKRQRWVLKLDFVDAKPTAPVAEAPAPGRVSYFKGSPAKWRTGLRTYGRLVYHDLWPGIDLAYWGTGSSLKYEFRVDPGADPGRIRMAWRGASGVTLDRSGAMRVATGVRAFTDSAPVSHQPGREGGRPDPVSSAFRLTKATSRGKTEGTDTDTVTAGFGFEVGSYDRTRPLVIDPATFVYAGFVGGGNQDIAFAVAVDSSGAAYVTGETSSSEPTFPETVGPDLTFNGTSMSFTDGFVAKVAPDGTSLVYCGYLGGGLLDRGLGIAVDSDGAAYVSGETLSTDFPVTGSLDTTANGGLDAFIAKVNPSGSALEYAGYIGGDSLERGRSVAVDSSKAAYVGGVTSSNQATFPETVGPDLTHNQDLDAFVAKVHPDGNSLVYAGYIGGQQEDEAYGIAVDSAGAAYLTGHAVSTETTFPVTVGPDLSHNGGPGGGGDAFVTKVNPSGAALDYSGFIGGDSTDFGFGIDVDATGAAYVTGQTRSTETTFPVAVGPDLTHNGGPGGLTDDAFIAKVQPGGATLGYAGYIGGNGVDIPRGVAVDSAGAAYITGQTTSTQATFPVTVGPDLTYGGDYDGFVTKVAPGGGSLVYAGYVGGLSLDIGYGVAVSPSGAAYVVGQTLNDTGLGFPTTVGPDTSFNGSSDAFVAKITEAETADLAVTKTENGPVTVGQEVTYTLTATNNGPDTAYGVTVTDRLPDSFTFTSGSPGCAETAPGSDEVVCQIGTLNPGASASVTRTIAATATAEGTFTNEATITGAVADPSPDNNTATVDTVVNPQTADLSVTKTDSPDPVTAGQNVTYTVVVTNGGPGTATGVVLTDTLPPSFTFVSGSGCTKTSSGPDVVRCDIGTLTSGMSATRLITATANSAGTAVNSVTASATTVDPNGGNNTATQTTTVNAAGPTCFGEPATITGTAGDDQINGTPGRDVIIAGAGHDTVNGHNGPDLICGGDGPDELMGGNGNDRIDGGGGDDHVLGDNGDDHLLGGADNDQLLGGPGTDVLDGGSGSNHNIGGPGSDSCTNPSSPMLC
ncbi:DUF11 domain-containing protein [Streptomyces sp. NRRL S-87]|uniref:DUF7948 domain-containing protein n=1 Tax=Streptomyces sp. NRRL S-87 TaxID=1463920 RepID=UPI00131EC75F|nr:DUF11 domain-containing protein [Streptomyces sp. NRRL S-87]